MQYFIHGDDFGRSPAKSNAIDELIRSGAIHTTSLLVNLDDTDHAMELAKSGGYADRVCLHLNFSEGEPLTQEIRKTGLCSASGKFRWAQSKRILTTCMTLRSIRAIRSEAEAQMKRFRESGFASRRIDSHDWLLFNLPIWIAVKPLLKQYGFTITRKACDNWISNKPAALRRYYRFMQRRIEGSVQQDGTWAGGLVSFRKALKKGAISAHTRAEIMTHPELVDGALFDVSNHERVPMDEVVDSMEKLAQEIASPSANLL